MGVTYFKRFRMEIPLAALGRSSLLPNVYQLIRWDISLIPHHADAKYRSFCSEIDADVFPCLGDPSGCLRLMEEISDMRGFIPDATWLVIYRDPIDETIQPCGTVQGIGDDRGCGSIQNLGVTPEHRGMGIGSVLLLHALDGFRRSGLQRASLEVTAQNADAVRLYRRLGFRRVKTVYKAVEVAYS